MRHLATTYPRRPARRSTVRAVAGLLAVIGLTAAAPGTAGAAVANPRTPTGGTADVRFVQFVTSSNQFYSETLINNTATNGKPHALLFVTPNYNPGNTGSGTYDDHPIGVMYDLAHGEWAVFNEDSAPMQPGLAFNVLVIPQATGSAFTVAAKYTNISGDSVYINRTATNSHSSVLLQVTQNWNPRAAFGNYNNDNVGVRYDTARKQWAIFEEDQAAMPRGAAFNVLVGTKGTGAVAAVLKATTANTKLNWTLLSNSDTSNNYRAMVFATPDYSPGGAYDNSPIGVWYDKQPRPRKWGVINQNTAVNMPIHAAFNLLIYRTR